MGFQRKMYSKDTIDYSISYEPYYVNFVLNILKYIYYPESYFVKAKLIYALTTQNTLSRIWHPLKNTYKWIINNAKNESL